MEVWSWDIEGNQLVDKGSNAGEQRHKESTGRRGWWQGLRGSRHSCTATPATMVELLNCHRQM